MQAPSSFLARPIIFFDWDDTILNSTQLAELGLRQVGDHSDSSCMDSAFRCQLSRLEHSALRMLTHAQTLGEVVIVTNGETGWVELSAHKFLPGLLPIIGTLRVISARSTYQCQNPACPITWKALAFNAIVDIFLDSNQLISIGDSLVERNAARLVARGRKVMCKTIKFCERPSLDQLLAQQQVVFMSLSEVVQTPDHLDLALTIAANKPLSSPSTPSMSITPPITPPLSPISMALASESAFTAGPDLVPPVGAN